MIWIALIFWYDLIVPSHFWIFGSDQNATSLGVWLVWANIYFIVKRNIMLEKKKEKVAFFKITFWSFFCFYFYYFFLFVYSRLVLVMLWLAFGLYVYKLLLLLLFLYIIVIVSRSWDFFFFSFFSGSSLHGSSHFLLGFDHFCLLSSLFCSKAGQPEKENCIAKFYTIQKL